MKPGSSELTETFQALDDAGTVHSIKVYAKAIVSDKPDGTTEQNFGSKCFKTADDHPVNMHEDGTFEDTVTGVIMRRIESP